MRKLLGGMTLAAVVLSLPAVLEAQRRTTAQRPAASARHEFGVDLGAAYVKPEDIDGGIVIFSPVDVRVGFVSASSMMWEGRASLAVSSVGGETTYLITPGVNVLFANSPGRHRNGMYFTVGAGLLLADNGFNSGTAFELNGGIGWRKPLGTAAWRYEVGFSYTSESTDLGLPSTIAIGGRIGLSFWK